MRLLENKRNTNTILSSPTSEDLQGAYHFRWVLQPLLHLTSRQRELRLDLHLVIIHFDSVMMVIYINLCKYTNTSQDPGKSGSLSFRRFGTIELPNPMLVA